MRRFFKKWGFGVLLGAVLALGAASPASANFKVRVTVDGLTDAQHQQTFTWDGTTRDAFGDKYLAVNAFSLVSGDLLLSFTSSDSNQDQGQDYGSIARIDLNSVTLQNSSLSGHTIVLEATDTSFAFPAPPLIVHTTQSSTVTNTRGTTATTVNFVGAVDAGNAEFGDSFSTSPGTTKTYAAGATLSSSGALDLDKGGFNPSGDYSITAIFTFNLAGRGNINSAGGTVEVVTPVPAGLAMAFSGVSVLGGFHWLRRRKK